MLQIRQEQIEAFASPDTPRFESASITHIKHAFPRHFSFLEETGARALVNHGRTRAKQYGLTDSSAALLYIDLTLLLGTRFDEDIQLPWAAGILNDKSLTQPLVKAERLHEYAMAYLDEVSGVNNEYIDQAQRTLLNQPPVGLENVDQILVLIGGEILEQGTEKELLKLDGFYRQMWALQNRILAY